VQTMDGYKAFLAEVRALTGLKAMSPDEDGLVTVCVDDKYNVSLQFVEATGSVLCFVELCRLPKDSPKSLYRDLLAGGLFGRETAGGYFTLESETETVIYNYFFDGDAAAKAPEEFISALEKILQLCDIWTDRINGELADAAGAQPPLHQTGMIIFP